MTKVYHSICRWTFNPGKGGFLPANIRPAWASDKLDTVGVIKLIKEKIAPRLPENVVLGYEVHYDTEIDEKNAADVADALVDAGMYLAMITPGAHSHFAYGGIASLDPDERAKANELGAKTVDLAYGPLRKAWHPEVLPTLVVWNGSFGYDLATPALRQMYQNLKESMAALCKHEEKAGGEMYIGVEPKPNEGHPAMLLPTVASAILLFRKIEEEFGVSRAKKGVNKEFGHSEMIGLDHIYDTLEELDNDAMVHMHLNSQGYNDGITLGGPGKFDIDHGVKITGMNVAIAALLDQFSFNRWKGHDMQPRGYDNEEQAIDRVIRSVLSWEACAKAAAELNTDEIIKHLTARETGLAEDMMREAVVKAQKYFDEMYKG
ncbi:MAG: xylose isomerase [Firmicutes bacterium]|nr:xylose isomerase [Bacillota bacterium]